MNLVYAAISGALFGYQYGWPTGAAVFFALMCVSNLAYHIGRVIVESAKAIVLK